MELILSVDPGWTLGWAVIQEVNNNIQFARTQDDESIEFAYILESGVMEFRSELGERGRYRNLWSFFLGIGARHKTNLTTLLIEPPFGRWRSTRNGEICGIIKLFGHLFGMNVVEMNVRSARSKLNLKGKENALAYAREWIGNEQLSQHEADAICQGLAYLKEKRK